MNMKGLNILVLVAFVLFSSACVDQKIMVNGTVTNKTGLTAEAIEVKLHLNREINPDRYYKRTLLQSDGTFQIKARSNRSYILEISGEKGSGRVFLPAESLQDKIDVTYPVTEKIVILHTNDRHFDLNNQDELAKELMKIRAEEDDVFLFEAGDLFVRHAHRWIVNDSLVKDTAWYGERALQMIQSMNELEYDLMTLGNHELAWIKDYTRIALDEARFPLLAANFEISTDKLPQLLPFIVLKTSTMRKVAVLGLTNDNTKREGVGELDLDSTVNNYILLKKESDVFVVLSHLGLKNDILLADQFPAIDAIIGGHSHNLLEEPLVENSVLIAQAGGNPHFVSDDHLVYLGKVVMILENGKITEKRGGVIKIVKTYVP